MYFCKIDYKMKTSISNKEIWRIACPIMLGFMTQTIISFTDTAFLGHLGMIELSASMMAGMYYFVFTTLAMGFAVGIQIFIARRYGESNFSDIGKIFFHGAFFVFLLGLALLGILYFSSGLLLDKIINSNNIYTSANTYLHFRQFGIIFVVFNFLFRSLYVGISNTKAITFSTIIMAIVNIFLDYGLIFGHWGFAPMGIAGAAIASLSAEISACLFFIIYTYFSVPNKYEIFKFHRIDKTLMSNLVKIAFPSMLQRLASFGSWFVFFIMIEKMGEMAIGISSLVRSVYMVLIIPSIAFASTANTLTSRLIGEGRSEEVFPTLWKIIKNSVLCALPLALIVCIIPLQIIQIYTDDITLATLAQPTIYIIAVATLILSGSTIFFESVSGTGNTHAAFVIECSIIGTYLIYIYFMSILVPIHFVWTAEWLYNFFIGLFSFIYLKKAPWQKKKL